MVSWRPVPTVIAVSSKDRLQIRESLANHPPRMRHLLFRCFSILISHDVREFLTDRLGQAGPGAQG